MYIDSPTDGLTTATQTGINLKDRIVSYLDVNISFSYYDRQLNMNAHVFIVNIKYQQKIRIKKY